ncbi:hypothetical protein C8J57DRAFT_1329138, partial [Mycena rebaudengoi]
IRVAALTVTANTCVATCAIAIRHDVRGRGHHVLTEVGFGCTPASPPPTGQGVVDIVGRDGEGNRVEHITEIKEWWLAEGRGDDAG